MPANRDWKLTVPARKDLPRKDIVRALERSGGVVGFAAQRLGVSPHTLKRRLLQDPTLQEDSEGLTRDRALSAVHQAIEAGDSSTVRWYLDRYGHKRGFGPVKVVLQCISDAEVKKILGVMRGELTTGGKRKPPG